MKKKIIGLALSVILALCVGVFKVNAEITVTVDGEVIEFDVKPELMNNRTMVPVRAIFEHLGAEVSFDEDSQTVTAKKGEDIIKTAIGSTTIYVNDVEKQIDVAPVIKDNRTLVPVRFVSESLGYYVSWDNVKRRVIITSDKFEVHFIDVGQADCTLIKSGGEAMLIDGGNRDDSELVANYLRNENIDFLDYIVCTHGHEDHVGGLTYIVESFDVGTIYANDNYKSEIYDNFFLAAEKKNIEVKESVIGETFLVGDAKAEILGPVMADYSDYNDSSIVLLVDYGETEFVFTGDAGAASEEDILAYTDDIEADILKVGHHGSSGSTTKSFLKAVNPKFAVISCGTGNSYGHPHRELIEILEDENIEYYRTDLLGSIIMASDMENITVSVNEEQETAQYIGNKKSKKFHTPHCSGLPLEKNSVYFKTVSDALHAGYKKCGICNPK